MEEGSVDDMNDVAVLSANLGMESESPLKIEPYFQTDVDIGGVLETTDDDDVTPLEGDVTTQVGSDVVGLTGEGDIVALVKIETDTEEQILQDDELLYTKDGNYICDICGEITAVRSRAEQHMMAHFEKMISDEWESTSVMTIEPSAKIVTSESLNSPVQFQVHAVNIQCNDDAVTLKTSESDTTVNVASPAAENTAGNKQYKCDICGTKLSDKTTIVEQHVGSHFETKPYKCCFCSFNTNEKYRIVQHVVSIHFGWELERPFTCVFCTYSSNERSRLTRHMLIHSGEKPFACEVCGFRFKRKDSLTKHMRVHAGKKAPSVVVENEVESDSHSSRLSGTTASEIEQQPNSYTGSSNEEAETTIITKVEPANVNIGDIVMANSENEPVGNGTIQFVILSDKLELKSEEIVSQDWGPIGEQNVDDSSQNEENVIHCDICGFKTAKKYRYKLREHMNLHTGEKPFACEMCDQKFPRKRNLDRHVLSHSGLMPYACKLCEFTCKQKSLLSKHIKTHIGQETSNSNGLEESNDTTQSHASPLGLGMNSENYGDSESSSLDDVNANALQDVVMAQQNFLGQAVDPLQLRLNEEHSQDSGLSSSSGPKMTPGTNRRFTCDFCNHQTDRKFEFEVHLRTHTGEKPFVCDICDKRYAARKTLNRHRKTHLVEKRCGLCDFTTSRETDLVTHMSTHTNKAVLQQPETSAARPFQLELRDDKGGIGPSGSSSDAEHDVKPFACEVCSYTTKVKADFEGHMMAHSTMDLNICEYCNKSYTAKRTLDDHIRESHPDKLFNCGSCDYNSTRKSDLADHIKTHIKSEAGKCDSPDDPAELTQVSSVSSTGVMPDEFSEHFKCVRCDFECDDITEWSAHMFMHTNEKCFSCDQCEFRTKFRASLEVHKIVHSEKKATPVTVTCEYCDYPFTTKADMNLHIMSCHSELYISCDVCDFKAFHKRSMELHKATHLKQFTCSLCDFKADKDSLLTRHIMAAHSDVTQFACSSCDFKASNIGDVEQHILTTHSVPAVAASSTSASGTSIAINPPEVKQYKCYACDFTAGKISQVEEHILSTHAVMMPEIAAPLLAPETRLDAPTSSNTGLEVYSCYACNFEANTVAQVQQHILITHNAATSETTVPLMDVTSEASNPAHL